MPTIVEKRREFRRLQETGCFVVPTLHGVDIEISEEGSFDGFREAAPSNEINGLFRNDSRETSRP